MTVTTRRCRKFSDGYPCARPVVEGHTMCKQHLAGERRRQENQRKFDERWAAQQAFWARQAAQEAFVKAWRAEHPQEVRRTVWDCPLCGKAVQIYVAGIDPHGESGSASPLAQRHQESHGSAWSGYLAAGQPSPERAGQEGEP